MKRVTIIGALCALAISALAWADGLTVPFSIPATTCTNQFIRSIAAATGIGTCATVSLTADVTATLPPGNGGTGVANSFNTTVTSATSIGRGQYQGSDGTSSATAGNIGEVISSAVASGSAASVTTGTPANVTSITLTAGDWEVFGQVYYIGAGGVSITQSACAISLTTGALPSSDTIGEGYSLLGQSASLNTSSPNCPSVRQLVTSNTSVFLIKYAVFTIGTMTAYGNIHARRMR